MSLNLKEVIAAAREHFQYLLPELTKSGEINDGEIRLEEIERDGENWVVTFSVPYRESAIDAGFGEYVRISGIPFRRLAKVVVIDGTNGNLIALRQRAA